MGSLRSEAVKKKTPEELAEIQNLPIPELVDRLAGLDADDLNALRALEVADNEGRKGALEAIDTAIAALTPGDGVSGTHVPPAAIEAAADPTPAWQREDYTGPLDIEQAVWRNANLKPAAAETKPVKAPKTK